MLNGPCGSGLLLECDAYAGSLRESYGIKRRLQHSKWALRRKLRCASRHLVAVHTASAASAIQGFFAPNTGSAQPTSGNNGIDVSAVLLLCDFLSVVILVW